MHWKALFDYQHLGCQDLPRDAQNNILDLVVSIKTIAKREVIGEAGRKDMLPVAELNGAAKPMIINKTNFKTLENLFGSTEVSDLVGKPFSLYQARVKAKAGGMVNALRIREQKPVVTLPELTPTHPRWVGAKKAIAEGNTTVDAIRGTFSLSAENEKLLTKND